MQRLCGSLLLLAGMSCPAPAQAADEPARGSRFSLRDARIEAAPERAGRYSVRGRIAPVASAGELREGENFVLIGRFAKAGVGCGADGGLIFRNGFEG
jgi:hypothetical protein